MHSSYVLSRTAGPSLESITRSKMVAQHRVVLARPPRLIRSWYIETVGGSEFGPYGDELEAHADAVMRRIERRFGAYAVYARTELDGTPDLDDIRTRLSFEIG